jgi:alpha-D-xyloside xylohydrolase
MEHARRIGTSFGPTGPTLILPYIYSVAWMITSKSYTPMRALVMDFPSDQRVLNIGDQYMFGPGILVSPVTQEDAASRLSTFHAGAEWRDFWTGAARQLAAIRASRLNHSARTRTRSTPPRSWPTRWRFGYIQAQTATSCYTRTRTNYERGIHARIPMQWNEQRQVITIGERKGSFPGMLEHCKLQIVFVRPGHGLGGAVTEEPDRIVE